MTTLSKELVGKKLGSYSYTVERGKIAEYCLAIGEKDPVYFDIDAAKKEGYTDIPAPMTFTTVIQFWGYPGIWDDMTSIGIDITRLLHLKEEYTYRNTIYPGKYSADVEIIDVKTGKMDMVTFRSVFKNDKNETAVEAEMAIVMRPEEKENS